MHAERAREEPEAKRQREKRYFSYFHAIKQRFWYCVFSIRCTYKQNLNDGSRVRESRKKEQETDVQRYRHRRKKNEQAEQRVKKQLGLEREKKKKRKTKSVRKSERKRERKVVKIKSLQCSEKNNKHV